MLLEEANARLKKEITVEELDQIHMLYCLLDLSKDDFCKIVDAVGVEKLAEGKPTYDRLFEGEKLLKAKKNYEKKKKEVSELDLRIEKLEDERRDALYEVREYEGAQHCNWLKKSIV